MQPSEARAPQLLILADGTAIPGAISARITANAYSAADKFQARFALNAAPAGYWSGWNCSSLEIRVGIDGGWTSLFLGVTDLLDVDLTLGIVELEGRDLTALLIDCLIEQSYPNLTASEIAQQLADQVGLTPQVTPTTDLIGRYWNSEWSRAALGNYGKARSAWDLLVWLAAEEEFDAFVSGDQLYFQPSDDVGTPVMLSPADCVELKLERSLALARTIDITVRSWNSRMKQAYSATASVPGIGSTIWHKIFVKPNLQMSDAEQMALREANVLAQHERVLAATLPGETSIGVRNQLILSGSGLDFDQAYMVEEVERSIDSENGFIEYVRARAASTGRAAVISGDN